MKFPRIVISFCTTVILSGCAYIIPPNENQPRNNAVLGTTHRPQLNDDVLNAKGPQSALIPSVQPQPPVARNNAPALPPVDDATKAQAAQEMAQAPKPPVPASMPPLGARHVPVENLQVAANDTPSLMNVPARPIMNGPDSSQERLTAVQSDLVKDRVDAGAAKDSLARDAAAEPSMLSQLPGTDTVVPPNDPIVAKPVVNTPPTVAPAPKPGTSITPVENVRPQAMMALKPLPPETTGAIPATVIAPPVHGASVSNDYIASAPRFAPPAPLNTVSVPTAALSAKPAPLVLKQPVENIAAQDLPPAPPMRMASVTPVAPMVMASTGRPNVTQGDFDPLAAADNAPASMNAAGSATSVSSPGVYGNDGYMTTSRYAARRY